jgi:hypothetical protein
MRYLAAVSVLGWLAATSFASAQVQMSVETQRTNFLLYERVDLIINIANSGESDLILSNDQNHPWLSFLVSKHNGLPVQPERTSNFKPLTLKVGETKRLRVNLTPLFSFREEGNYTAEAVVDLPGAGEIISDPVPFSVQRGREVWSETRPVDGSHRVYSLLRFSPAPDEMSLYLRVEDPSENLVFANLALGKLVAYVDPEVFFDPQGNLHVMQPISDGEYLYSRVDPDGKIVHQGIFSSYRSIPPRLTKLDDGSVVVVGGLEQGPNQQHETLSEGQRTAAVQPPSTPETMGSAADSVSDPAPLPMPQQTTGSSPEAQAPSPLSGSAPNP